MIVDLKEQLINASDVLHRTIISSPFGTVMNIQYHTIGAVVTPVQIL